MSIAICVPGTVLGTYWCVKQKEALALMKTTFIWEDENKQNKLGVIF